ncbi:hypothetical protein [Micromonospora zamorensis]|uniref:hypothetical protein n=1 Tax=Micromonospora zamorensis TaxID=709883 RepID=UPI0033B11862
MSDTTAPTRARVGPLLRRAAQAEAATWRRPGPRPWTSCDCTPTTRTASCAARGAPASTTVSR